MTSLTIFNNDTSTQLNNTTFSYLPSYSSASNPSILFNDGTSGIYNATANSIIFYTSGTTALTIDTNQGIFGNGTGLTNIGYTNVINKPTNFPSDWNSTIINKPSNFPSDWNSTIINKPSNFPSDWNSTIINKPDLTVYATNTNLNNLSSNSVLGINNLNATSTTLFNKTNFTNLYVSGASTLLSSLNVAGVINGSGTALTNLNYNAIINAPSLSYYASNIKVDSLSTTSTLSINNLNATSTTLLGYINTNNTAISNLNATSTTILGLVNGHTTQISNLNATSTTILGLVNGHTTQISNLNATSTTILGLVNGHTTQISNLNATSTTLLGYTNTNNTAISNLNATSTTILGLVNGHTTQISNLNATSTTLLGYINTNNTAISNLNATSTTILGLVNGHTTQISNLNATSTTIFNKTNFTNLLVSGASTINSSLNIKGREMNEGMNIVDSSTYTNQYQLLISPPTLTTNSTLQTIQQNIGYNQILDLQPIGGSIKLSQNTTALSNLNVLGNTTLNNIDCGGGISINGSNAVYNITSVDSGNYSNTYLTLRPSITNNDWCYIRQIGSDNTYKLAFDFHDDGNDARFCIRNVQSTAVTDIISEVFTVDNGNVSCTGTITNGSSSYIYAGGLRLGGFDTGNTIWNNNSNLGLTTNNGYNVNIGLNGGKGGSIMTINNNAVYVNNSSLFITPDTTSKNAITMYCYPNGIVNSNGNSNTVNLRVACNTTGFATSDFLTVQVPDGWNGIDTIVTLASNSGANSGYFNASRIILDGSYNSNSGNGNYGSSILFQSQISGGWKTNFNIKTISDNSCRLGISNDTPLSMLHLGNCTVTNSAPVIVFGKNVNGTGFRNAFIGYTDSFYFVIGDYGNTNTSNTLTSQLAIIYNAPASSLVIQSSGYVQMAYGYGTGSDERIKTNIKTIENALDKTLLLRGVEYNDIRIEPEKKRIGLIAQEVELIIPEVVRTGDDGLKGIEYQNLVGLLIEAIKEQQKQINDLKNILIKNNLN